MTYEIVMYTPYKTKRLLVESSSSQRVEEYAQQSFVDFLYDNADDCFEEYSERGEDDEYYESELWEEYVNGSDFDIRTFNMEEYDEYDPLIMQLEDN